MYLYQNLKSLRIWPTIFSGMVIFFFFCKKSNFEHERVNGGPELAFYWENFSVNLKVQHPGGAKSGGLFLPTTSEQNILYLPTPF